MMFLSRAESSYLHQHLSVVRHVTLDPEGPVCCAFTCSLAKKHGAMCHLLHF